MSYNSDAASPSTPGGARDWIFHSTHSHHQRTSRRRGFSTYPTQFNSAAALFPPRPPTDDSTPVLSSYPSKFSRFRRRNFEFGRNYEKSMVAVDDTSDRGGVAEVNPKEEVHARPNNVSGEEFFRFSKRKILITVLSSLVQKNFSLHNEIIHLQGSLLNQLAIANESLGEGIVVVMAKRDKEEMELDIAKMEFDFRGTSVISEVEVLLY